MRRQSASQREATAFHEAGHAVVAWLRGARVRAISVIRTKAEDGFVAYRPVLSKSVIQNPGLPKNRLKAERCVDILLAGSIAQRHFSPRSIRFQHGRQDFISATEVALMVAGSDESASAFLAWRSIATTEAVVQHWELIERVAHRLLATGTMSGEDLIVCLTEQEKPIDPLT